MHHVASAGEGPRDTSRSRLGVDEPSRPILRGVIPMPAPGRRGVIEPVAAVEVEPALVEVGLAGRRTLGGTGGRLSKSLIISAPFDGSSLADSDFKMSKPDDGCEVDSTCIPARKPATLGGAPASRSPLSARVGGTPD